MQGGENLERILQWKWKLAPSPMLWIKRNTFSAENLKRLQLTSSLRNISTHLLEKRGLVFP